MRGVVALTVHRLVLIGPGIIVTRDNSKGLSVPKVIAMAIGTCLAVALAVKAPVEAAAPSKAAERIVDSRVHKNADDDQGRKSVHRSTEHRAR